MIYKPEFFAKGPNCPDDVTVEHDEREAWIQLPFSHKQFVFNASGHFTNIDVKRREQAIAAGWLVYNDPTPPEEPKPEDVLGWTLVSNGAMAGMWSSEKSARQALPSYRDAVVAKVTAVWVPPVPVQETEPQSDEVEELLAAVDQVAQDDSLTVRAKYEHALTVISLLAGLAAGWTPGGGG